MTMLITALFASGTSTLVSCKDSESDDIQEVNNNVAKLDADLAKKIADLQTQIGNIKSCTCDQDAFNTLKNDLAALQGQFSSSSTTWNEQIAALNNAIKNLPADDTSWKAILDQLQNKTIPALQKAAMNNEAAIKDLNGKTSQNADDIKKLDGKTAANSEAIKQLSAQIDSLKSFAVDLSASLVTNAIVQGTYTPAAGSLTLPLDIQSNMLVTYYGENLNGSFPFPTNNPARFYNVSDASNLSPEDVSGVSKVTIADGTLLDGDGAVGNAGTVYVTLNPNTVDASGVQFSLQNSRGESSSVTLTSAAKSDDLLTWGYTRAAADNNFYAVKATLSKDDIEKVKVSLNTTNLKAAVKRYLNDRSENNSSLKALARQIIKFVYDNMDTDLPRLALTTEFGLADKKAKNVSEMNILATAYKPLGFGALDNIDDASHVPGIGTAEKYMVDFINSVKLNAITIKSDVLAKVTKVDELGKITANGDGTYSIAMTATGTDAKGNIAQGEATGTATASQLSDLLSTVVENPTSDLNAAIEAYNNNLVSVNDLRKEINTDLNYNIKLDNAKTSALNKMSSYLDNLNERYSYWFNRIKRSALKPCMLFIADDGAHRITAAGVTVEGTKITLVPTTYTYELIAPAYKKFIKVYSGSDVLCAQVIPGDQRAVTVDGLKSGSTYTIVYEAVDYSGKVVARKYTLRVK